jgi:DNA repair protein RecO (recombination protein O)
MLVSTEGIVLRQFSFSDTSLIVKIFTRDYGLLSFIIKGVKSKKNNKANLYKPVNLLALSFYLRENQSLKHVKEAQLLFAPDAQNFGIFKSAITMFMVELINHTIPDDSSQPDHEKYSFIDYSIQYLRTNKLNPNFYLSFMYQYSIYLGIEISANVTNKLDILSEYENLNQLSMTKEDRHKLFLKFEFHYLENLTNYKSLKSIDILNEILQ